MDNDLILIQKVDGVAVVTLNRPAAMNALSVALRATLGSAIRELDVDDEVRVIILTGAGNRAFSAGLDLKELRSNVAALGSYSEDPVVPDPLVALAACRKPVIAAINGVAITAGFELALACDILIASDTARFADTHARVGILPGWGLSQRLSRTIGVYRARELSLTGNFIDASTADRWGLVNRVVSAGELLGSCMKLAADIASVDPTFIATYKNLINDGFELGFGAAMTLEKERSSGAGGLMPPTDFERRRIEVQARGRTQ